MSISENGYCMGPADYAVISGGANGNANGWGGGSFMDFLLLFIILFGIGGWGGGRNYSGGGSDGVMNNYVLTSDFSQLSRQISDAYNSTERKLDNISSATIQGFAGINTGLIQQGYESRLATQGVGSQLAQCCCDIREAVSGVNYNAAMNTNALQGAIKDCCCTTQQNIKDVNYNLSTQANGLGRQISDTGYMLNTAVDKGFCQTNYNNSTNTRDIIDSQHADADRIIARLDAMETNRLREQLDAERASKLALQGALDRAQLRTDIVNDVRPCPIPAYQTCNPWAYQTNSCSGCCN